MFLKNEVQALRLEVFITFVAYFLIKNFLNKKGVVHRYLVACTLDQKAFVCFVSGFVALSSLLYGCGYCIAVEKATYGILSKLLTRIPFLN